MLRLIVVLVTLVAVTSSASVSRLDDPSLFNGRIVGGIAVDISAHPHQVSMRYKGCDTCSFNHRCGGSIINERIIVTAAHCVSGVQAKRLQIVAGTNERNGVGAVALVEKIISHENYYKDVPYENDVAILILANDLPLNGFSIAPVELATKHPANGQISTVTGWGTTSSGGISSNVLLEVDVPIVSNNICDVNYGGVGRINDSMLCAGAKAGGKDACQGDSGGPLVVNRILTGIVSWGDGCAKVGKPGVYASVANLRPWIDDKIAQNS